MVRRVKITDTTFRDAHQSLWANRMNTADMLPIAEKLDSIGYHSLEVWGGSTFDVCLRYLNEDPWERLRLLKKNFQRTPLQMLLRGQSLVGYKHYPDDVVDVFIAKAVENGIDIIRIFDALNDVHNLNKAIMATKTAGAHVQAAIIYTISPVHTDQHYLDLALQLKEMGADSICIKDMAGLLAPYIAYDLIKMLKKEIDLPVQLHCHYIGGLALGTYLKAVEAGVDVIDTATVPLANGASQPSVETVVRALQGTPYDTGINIHELFVIAEYFEELRKARGYERGVTRINDMRVFDHQIPGGTISNLVAQLEEQKALYRLGEVMEEIPRVREELGYPPLITPTSQIIGTQAVLNVLTGERYKLVPGEVRDYVQGYYGNPPAPLNSEIVQKVLGDRQRITCRPADLLEDKMSRIKGEIGDLAKSEEDYISCALFPQVGKRFLETRQKGVQVIMEQDQEGKVQPPKLEHEIKTGRDETFGGRDNILQELITYGKAKVSNIAASKGGSEMNLQDIKELIKLVNETGLAEVSLESDGVKLAIKKNVIREAEQLIRESLPSVREIEPREEKNVPVSGEPRAGREIIPGLVPVKSPMVGMFYRSASPEDPPYVRVGDRVEKGQALCIIEAMKLMNKIESETGGEIVDILVENGHPVEYGQTLITIKSN